MDEDLRILHEAMVVSERLRVLAQVQVAYWEELTGRGIESSVAEQLVLEWSRHAYPMTFRALPEPVIDGNLDALLADADRRTAGSDPSAQPPAPVAVTGDPSSVPPGEPWLQLVDELPVEELPADDHADEDDASQPASSHDDCADERAA